MDVIVQFLQSKLHLQVKTTELRSAVGDHTPFLGFTLRMSTSDQTKGRGKRLRAFAKLRNRTRLRRSYEEGAYLKMVEAAAKKVYRGSVLEGISESLHPRAKRKDLKKKIACLGVQQGNLIAQGPNKRIDTERREDE